MAKTVGDLLIKLGVDGLDGVTALKSALRTLGQASNASDKQLEGLRKEIVQVAKASNVSQQAIRGQIDAFKGLKAQASIGSTVYKRLGKDIDTLTQSLDRLSRKEDEVAKKPATTKQLAAQFTSAVPEKTTRQLQAQQEMLQKSAVSSVEYTQRLVRLNAVTQEFTRSQQRQAVIAGNVVAMTKAQAAQTLQSSKVSIENTHTTAALKQKIAELAQDIDNIDVGSKEYITTSNRLKEAQEELNQVLGISSAAFDDLSRAQERAERRAKKLADIQQYYGTSKTGEGQAAQRAGGFRDPETGAMIARGTRAGRVSLAQQPVREISGLYRSIGDIGMSGITADIDRMGKSVKEVTRDIKAATAASNGSANSLQAQRSALVQLQAGLDPVSQDFRELAREIDKVDRKLGKLGKKRFSLKGAAQTVGAVASAGIFGGAPGAAGALLGAPFGPGGAVLGGGLGASAGVAAQQVSGFTNYAASIRLAEKAMRRIIEVENNRVESARRNAIATEAIEYAVNKLNVEREDATIGMTRLSAAVLGAGGNIETAALAFLGTTKAIKATKGSAEDVRGGLTALVQMFSKGKISAEELSGQLGERFPAAVTAFAEANEISTQELQQMLKNGEVGLDRLVKFLVFATKKYSAGSLEMAASAEESGERQKRAFDEVRRELGEQLIDVGAKLQEGIADSLATLTPVIVNIAKAVAGAVELIINGIVFVIKNFRNLIDVVTVLAGGAVLGSLLTMLAKVGTAMGAKGFAFSVSLLARFIRFKLVTSVGLLITKLKALALTMARNPITLLALGITALGVSMFRASQRHKNFIDDITSGVTSLEDAGKRVDKYKKRLDALNKIQGIIEKDPTAARGLQEVNKARPLLLKGAAGQVQRLAESLQDPDLPALSIGTTKGLLEAQAITSTQLSGIRAAIAGRAPKEEGINIDELMDKAFVPSLDSTKVPSLDGGGSGDGGGGREDISDAMMQARINGMRQIITLADVEAKLANDLLQISLDDLKANEAIVAKAQAHFNAEQSRLQIEQQLQTLQTNIAAQVDKARLATGEITQEQFNQNELERRRVELQKELLPLLLSEKKTEEEIEEIIEAILSGMEKGQDKSKSFVDGLKEVIKEATNLNDRLAEYGVQAVERLGDAFADFVATGKASFKELTVSILQDLARIFARMALFSALKAAFPGLGIFKNGGVVKGMTPPTTMPDSVSLMAANGMAFAKNKIVPYAKGGIVNKPTLFQYASGGTGRFGLMGEAGAEAILPLRRGANGKLGVEASGTTSNVVVNVDASGSSVQGDQPNAKALGQAIGTAVQAELIKQKRPGGLLS